jgi:hypothetical protein
MPPWLSKDNAMVVAERSCELRALGLTFSQSTETHLFTQTR